MAPTWNFVGNIYGRIGHAKNPILGFFVLKLRKLSLIKFANLTKLSLARFEIGCVELRFQLKVLRILRYAQRYLDSLVVFDLCEDSYKHCHRVA